jgi:hypothetical protein
MPDDEMVNVRSMGDDVEMSMAELDQPAAR